MRKRVTEENLMAEKARSNGKDEHRSWLGKQKDKLVGTKEERAKAKAEKHKAREEERKRHKVSIRIVVSRQCR